MAHSLQRVFRSAAACNEILGNVTKSQLFNLEINGTQAKNVHLQPAKINKKLMELNILGGLDVNEKIPNGMLLCVTEMNSKEDIDALVAALAEFK